MPVDDPKIADEEIVHRRVLPGHVVRGEGRPRLTSQAFADRSGHPSVDRVLLRSDAELTRESPGNGVVRLSVAEIRSIADVRELVEDARSAIQYQIDVRPRPLAHNTSHAQVEPDPEYRKPRLREKLQKALQRLANDRPDAWVLLPEPVAR